MGVTQSRATVSETTQPRLGRKRRRRPSQYGSAGKGEPETRRGSVVPASAGKDEPQSASMLASVSQRPLPSEQDQRAGKVSQRPRRVSLDSASQCSPIGLSVGASLPQTSVTALASQCESLTPLLASVATVASSLARAKKETVTTTPPSWPGRYMVGGASWPSIKGSAVIPGRKNHPLRLW
jgi:hypothetical protein